MTREDSIRQIENYPPFNEQEEKDKALPRSCLSVGVPTKVLPGIAPFIALEFAIVYRMLCAAFLP